MGSGSGPSKPQGISTTDGWSIYEIILAIFGGFLALICGNVLFKRFSKRRKATAAEEYGEDEQLLPENINF